MMTVYTAYILAFISFAIFLVFLLPEIVKQHKSVKPGKQKMLERFEQLESEIASPITEYECFETGHESVWRNANYAEFKKAILASYYIDRNHGSANFRLFLYKIEEGEKKIYLASANASDGLAVYDWQQLMHHEEWVSRPNPIKKRIDDFHAQRREQSKNAQWWEFWKIDDFE